MIGFVASPAHGEIHPIYAAENGDLMLDTDYTHTRTVIPSWSMIVYNFHKCHSWLNQILLIIIIYMVPQVQNHRSRYTQVVLVSDPKLYCRKQTADW